MADLKPCPFCGGEKLKLESKQKHVGHSIDMPVVNRTYSVRCNVCYARGGCVSGKVIDAWRLRRGLVMPEWLTTDEALKAEAAEAWNRRATSEDLKYKECRYYTENSFWGGGCLGTKEIDPCVGASCKCWKPKEDNDGND